MTRTDDRGLEALAQALHSCDEEWPCEIAFGFRADAARILGERAVFWPTGTDEYRELIRQYQAEIERLRAALVKFGTHGRTAWSIDADGTEHGGWLCVGNPCKCGLILEIES